MNQNIITHNKDIAGVFVVTAGILMIPLVAMQFTNEVDWDLTDFIVMGALLFFVGLLIALAGRKIKDVRYRIAVILVLLGIFFLTWAELAVGIFGTPFAGS